MLADPAHAVISTHAPLAGRDSIASITSSGNSISTHAPLAGRDITNLGKCNEGAISTHAPLAGRDQVQGALDRKPEKFQPTRPLRGATAKVYKSLCTFLR